MQSLLFLQVSEIKKSISLAENILMATGKILGKNYCSELDVSCFVVVIVFNQFEQRIVKKVTEQCGLSLIHTKKASKSEIDENFSARSASLLIFTKGNSPG